MSKYIDAEKLIAEIEKIRQEMIKKGEQKDLRNAIIRRAVINSCNDFLALIASLQQERPKFKVGELIVCKYNPHLTYKILATNIPNELGKTDYKVEIFTDGKPGLLGKPHNIRLISSDKIEDWGELVQQEQPKVDLVAELKHHLATTPKEQLEKEWKELEPWCNIGPSVREFLYGKQPDVDLENEIDNYYHDNLGFILGSNDTKDIVSNIARHFYELGLNARKENTK